MDGRAKRIERRLERPLLAAALLTIPAIAIEQSSVGEPWDTVATVLNWLIWLAFVAELVVMLRVVPDRGRWLREHPLDLAIVVLTPPFLPSALQAARVFRLLRLLRLVRAAVLVRRLLSTEGVRDAAVLALLTVLGGGAAYAGIERRAPNGDPLSAWDGVWWVLTTVTMVGYGDNYPTTDGGRIIAVIVMLVGIGFVAILTAAAAERFMRSRAAERANQHELLAKLDDTPGASIDSRVATDAGRRVLRPRGVIRARGVMTARNRSRESGLDRATVVHTKPDLEHGGTVSPDSGAALTTATAAGGRASVFLWDRASEQRLGQLRPARIGVRVRCTAGL